VIKHIYTCAFVGYHTSIK